jgi:hypothetical protein
MRARTLYLLLTALLFLSTNCSKKSLRPTQPTTPLFNLVGSVFNGVDEVDSVFVGDTLAIGNQKLLTRSFDSLTQSGNGEVTGMAHSGRIGEPDEFKGMRQTLTGTISGDQVFLVGTSTT